MSPTINNEILIYQDGEIELNVSLENETVWLNRHQLAELFDRDIKTIGKHISNIFKERELEKNVVVAKFATTTQHGAIQEKTQTKLVEYYNLDVIISVGYRVKSQRGVAFRQWATKVLKEYIYNGIASKIRTIGFSSSMALKSITSAPASKTWAKSGLRFRGWRWGAYETLSLRAFSVLSVS